MNKRKVISSKKEQRQKICHIKNAAYINIDSFSNRTYTIFSAVSLSSKRDETLFEPHSYSCGIPFDMRTSLSWRYINTTCNATNGNAPFFGTAPIKP